MTASVEEVELRNAVRAVNREEPPVQRALVACSGGPDSIALAAAVAWDAAHGGPAVSAVVVDHQLQRDSDRIAAQAADACRTLGLDAAIVQVNVASTGSLEAAARAARYEALTRAAADCGADAVYLGHTRDDQAETVLLRLMRGSGARSLAAMRPIVGLWRRPFLGLSRATVHRVADAVAGRAGFVIWHDPHNEDPAFARVEVRRLLQEWSGGEAAIGGLARSAQLLADDADFLDSLAEQAYTQCYADQDLVVDELTKLPRALRTRVIRHWLRQAGSDDLEFGHVVAVEALVSSWHGQGPISVPGPFQIERSYGRLRLLPVAEESTRAT